MVNEIYSWQYTIWEQLVNAVQKKHLPHALLFVGQNGIGKKKLAENFASALLCTELHKSGKRCGSCHACHLSNAQTHPDFIRVESESDHAIKIDQIREVTSFVNQTALLGGYRVVMIDPASAMNTHAANALLKTLEEPTPNTLLILISDQILNLPATIISRCQKIIFPKPTLEHGLTWLKEHIKDDSVNLPLLLTISNGAPLAALQFFNQDTGQLRKNFYDGLHQLSIHQVDPVELAERLYEKNFKLVLVLLFSWVNDLLRFKAIDDHAPVVNQDFQSVLLHVSRKLSLIHLLGYISYLQKIYAYVSSGQNLNQRLMLEEVLIKWILAAS